MAAHANTLQSRGRVVFRLATRGAIVTTRFVGSLIAVACLLDVGAAHAWNEAHLNRLKASGHCRQCDLVKANLARANLSGANLTGSNLSGANFSEANLSRADLSGSNLAGSSLIGANLTAANLTGAMLTGASLRSANLSGANLSSSNLASADLNGANLRRVNFFGARGLPPLGLLGSLDGSTLPDGTKVEKPTR